MITDYQIEMLNVGDADAFVVYYITDYSKQHLVLIDAGRYGDGENVLNHLNTYYRNLPVELAIVTHPDDDHYGGYICMLEHLKANADDAVQIRRFWVNDPREHFTIRDVEEDISAVELDKRLGSVFKMEGKMLLDLIDKLGIQRDEIFVNTIFVNVIKNVYGGYSSECRVAPSGQEGFYVLGPSLSYFEAESTAYRYDKELNFVKETPEDQDIEDDEKDERLKEHLSYVLDEADRDPSSHNKSSLIVLFQPNKNEKFLFTGDASTDSFEAMIPESKSLCKGVTWLKVPHHGSKANLNTRWIKHFKPGQAFISTLRRGKYLNQCTINALKKNGCDVVSTHNNNAPFITIEDKLNRNLGSATHC